MITNRHENKLSEALSFVSDLTGIDEKEIVSKNRNKEIVMARHLTRYYLRTHYNFSLQVIGKLTNGHHASIIHSVDYINDCAKFDRVLNSFKNKVDEVYSIPEQTSTKMKVLDVLNSKKNVYIKCNRILDIIKESNEQHTTK